MSERSNGLPDFDLEAECPKCGHGEVGVRWESGAHWPCLVGGGHLDRTCERCGYSWPERPLDAEAAR